jgi:hypothetical protein
MGVIKHGNHPSPSAGTLSGPRVEALANGGNLASEAQTAKRVCQGPHPMYCHESKGVIKTEWPAVLLRSNIDLLSLLQQLSIAFRYQNGLLKLFSSAAFH